MNMNKYKYFSLTIVMSLIGLCSCSDDNDYLEVADYKYSIYENKVNKSELPMDAQVEANQLNNVVISGITSKSTRAMFGNAEEKVNYPDFWGGSYVTPDGRLVALIKHGDTNGIKRINNIAHSSLVTYKECSFSYSELLDIKAELDSKIPTANNSVKSNIVGYGILDDKNAIEVSVIKLDDAFIEDFKRNICKSPAITFFVSGPIIEENTYFPGAWLTVSNGHGSCAFRAREKSGNKRRGIVTAGHVISVGSAAYVGSTIIGYCSQSFNSGQVDAAFIPLDTLNHTLSNFILNGADELSTSTSLPGVGTFVNMRGSETGVSGTGGYIKSINYTYIINGVTFNNMTTATYSSQAGDSGGIIYTYVSKTNTRYTVGIHKGTSKTSGVKVFTKASVALSKMGLERY